MTEMMHNESPADCRRKRAVSWETNQDKDSGRTVTTLLAPATTRSLAERPQPKCSFPIREDNLEVLLDLNADLSRLTYWYNDDEVENAAGGWKRQFGLKWPAVVLKRKKKNLATFVIILAEQKRWHIISDGKKKKSRTVMDILPG